MYECCVEEGFITMGTVPVTNARVTRTGTENKVIVGALA